jgi:bifunctional DNA-binding transcriptional regulator/antitoxin component of YhaV-PrlF toxin-antitoxin module
MAPLDVLAGICYRTPRQGKHPEFHMADLGPETLALLKRRLEEIERNVQLLKQLLSGEGETRPRSSPAVTPALTEESGTGPRVIYGRFDGEHMEGEDVQLYPVPANYASKSKLVEGDKLKLTIEPDGSFIYKQISPADRRRVLGTFRTDAAGNYVVEAEGKSYRILLASVTFYRLEPGDQVTILLPTEGEAHWGAVENALKASKQATGYTAQPKEDETESL